MIDIKIRVVALVINNNDILIVEQTHKGESWLCFPGGHQELGEKQTDTIVRELKEELDLLIVPIRLLYIAEFMLEDEQATEFYWLCKCNNKFSISQRETVITATHWISLGQLGNYDVLPGDLPPIAIPPVRS